MELKPEVKGPFLLENTRLDYHDRKMVLSCNNNSLEVGAVTRALGSVLQTTDNYPTKDNKPGHYVDTPRGRGRGRGRGCGTRRPTRPRRTPEQPAKSTQSRPSAPAFYSYGTSSSKMEVVHPSTPTTTKPISLYKSFASTSEMRMGLSSNHSLKNFRTPTMYRPYSGCTSNPVTYSQSLITIPVLPQTRLHLIRL